MPVQIANTCQGNREELLNPGAIVDRVPQLLVAPNPNSWDEQWTFKVSPFLLLIQVYLLFTVNQCIALAQALGLPPLPHGALVLTRQLQIATYLGVDM